jgi:hypothetical protein
MMLRLFVAVCYSLPFAVTASPLLEKRGAASYVGLSTSDVYPPAGTSVNTAEFPGESVVGFAGPYCHTFLLSPENSVADLSLIKNAHGC